VNTLLAARLISMLNVTHQQFGLDPEPLAGLLGGGHEVELHELSPAGVLAFVGDYVLAAWPDDEMPQASRVAHRLLSARLKARGFTRHMVHPRNFRSVKLTRKMGATPLGVDADGFVHYILRSERFPHGQEVAAAEAT
jgi:hypothetical protein